MRVWPFRATQSTEMIESVYNPCCWVSEWLARRQRARERNRSSSYKVQQVGGRSQVHQRTRANGRGVFFMDNTTLADLEGALPADDMTSLLAANVFSVVLTWLWSWTRGLAFSAQDARLKKEDSSYIMTDASHQHNTMLACKDYSRFRRFGLC